MKPAVKNWWRELADQYEEWAENPPTGFHGRERYTCNAVTKGDWGFRSIHNPAPCLMLLWQERYGRTPLPAGDVGWTKRQSRRFEFCHHMAETIREAIGEE